MHSYQFIWDGSLAKSVISVKNILVATQKDKAIELWDKLDNFMKIFDWDLLIEIWVEQGLLSMLIFIVQVVWFMVSAAMVATVAKQKELDDLVSTLGGNKLKICKPYMEGTCSDILQVIETKVKNTGSHNMIWIRRSPDIGKSALVASILTWLQNQNRYIILFQFDCTQSTTITTDSLWHVITCDLAYLYPSFC